jgi:hypothetical protein
VVLGKRIARKHVHVPKPKKKTEPTAGELQAALDEVRASAPRVPFDRPPAFFPTSSLHPVTSVHLPTQHDWSTPVSRTPSQGEQGELPTPSSVQMASPSPISTPYAPTVAMGSPSPSSTPGASPMHIDAATLHARAMAEGARIDAQRAAADTTPRRQTARRGGGPPQRS